MRPSRALGQNFIADANVAAKIVRAAEVVPGDRVVEVGPGVGSLTLALLAAGASVTAVEIDRHLLPVLNEVLAGRDVVVHEADALHADWSSVAPGEGWVMVSSLPYNIATPLLLKMLAEAPGIVRFIVLVQREVGERLAASPGSRVYGAVSAKVAYYASCELAGRVPASVFVPRPRVDSVVVRMRRHESAPVAADRDEVFGLIDAGFASRRKTLRNSLSAVLGGRTEAVLARAGIDPSARAERLSLVDWARLSDIAGRS